MDFEAYLLSKKIDSTEFQKAEPDLWKSWQVEFEQMHPGSFTAQKLYLINPLRRKYLLKNEPVKTAPPDDRPADQQHETASKVEPPTSANPKPLVPRPVFKPKPKMS